MTVQFRAEFVMSDKAMPHHAEQWPHPAKRWPHINEQ